jgi:hypothetical protein
MPNTNFEEQEENSAYIYFEFVLNAYTSKF